jgi:hypothetical protein
MNNHLNLNVLQDYIDISGGSFRVKVKWHKGDIYIEQDAETNGGVVYFTQMPLTQTAEKEMREEILAKMPGVGKVVVNNVLEVTQDVKEPNKIDLQNKFKQSMDFEIELNSNRTASVKPFTYFGIQRLAHDHTYVRALFTTNPYFAIIFNGIRIVPYERDLDEMGDQLVETVREFAKKRADENEEMQFKVEKAFEVTFYLGKENVTKNIQQMMNKQKEMQTSLDEFGFIAYIAFYKLFKGELNNSVPLNKI